jgi:hypothetical protein
MAKAVQRREILGLYAARVSFDSVQEATVKCTAHPRRQVSHLYSATSYAHPAHKLSAIQKVVPMWDRVGPIDSVR